MDTGLLEVLREAGDRWGPAGVARAATALIGDALAGDAVGEPEQPGHGGGGPLGARGPRPAPAAGRADRRVAPGEDRRRPGPGAAGDHAQKADGWVFTWAWSSPVGE
jgi:hypothetical protein